MEIPKINFARIDSRKMTLFTSYFITYKISNEQKNNLNKRKSHNAEQRNCDKAKTNPFSIKTSLRYIVSLLHKRYLRFATLQIRSKLKKRVKNFKRTHPKDLVQLTIN